MWLTSLIADRPITSEKSSEKDLVSQPSFKTLLTLVVGNRGSVLQPAQVGFGISFREFRVPLGTRLAFIPLSFALSATKNLTCNSRLE